MLLLENENSKMHIEWRKILRKLSLCIIINAIKKENDEFKTFNNTNESNISQISLNIN